MNISNVMFFCQENIDIWGLSVILCQDLKCDILKTAKPFFQLPLSIIIPSVCSLSFVKQFYCGVSSSFTHTFLEWFEKLLLINLVAGDIQYRVDSSSADPQDSCHCVFYVIQVSLISSNVDQNVDLKKERQMTKIRFIV